MIWRIFTRTVPLRYVFLFFLITVIIVYELKALYDKYQKESRFSYYKTYVNEIKDYAKKIESSDNKSFSQMQRITKLLRISLKRMEEKNEDGRVCSFL